MKEFVADKYPQVITACCFLFLFVNIGFPSTSISVYQPYVAALPGIGDVGASTILTVRSVVTLLALTVVDKCIARLGIRVAASLSCVFTGLGFICYGFATSMVGFIAGAVVTGIAYALGGMVCMTMLLNRWFSDDVGTAIGFATVGSGVAGVLIPLLATYLIHAASLSMSYFVEGSLAIGIGVLIFLVVRNSPQDMGLQPHVSPDGKCKKRSHPHQSSPIPVPKGIRFSLYFAIVLIGIAAIGGQTFFSILMTSQGVDYVLAGTIFAVESFFLVVSKILTGRAFDLFGGKRASAIFFVIFITGLILCCLISADQLLIVWGAALFYGMGVSLATVGISVWSLELSDEEHRTKNIKRFQVCYNLGGCFFSFAPGILMELFGSYTISYEIMLVCAVVCAVLILRAYSWKARSTS